MAYDSEQKAVTSVAIVDVHMPFGSMVVLMVKWAIAAIPAMVILFLIGAVLAGLFGGIFAALGGVGT